MTLATALGHRYAEELPELVLPWAADPAPDPRTVVVNDRLGLELPEEVYVGNVPDTVAMAYAGHQFGGYSPRLGDGRALLLGELPDGRDVHLKGSGRTPFARGGDGKAPLGPMLREYVVSEAVHALGIPTTRALAVVTTGERVLREQGYEPGAILTRVAASHIRVGTFQYAAATGDVDLLRRLADHAVARHHPDATDALDLYRRVCEAQARLVAQWMLVGFVHGVMNTDNTTISGETIDYGPCAFMDTYDPATVFSSIDHSGRYAYANQPGILQWNLARLGEALLPLVDPDQDAAVEAATEVVREFPQRYLTHLRAGLKAKIGLPDAEDRVVDDLQSVLTAHHPDFTGFFRDLAAHARGGPAPIDDPWVATWLAAGPDPDAMDAVNPAVVPRNHLVQAALDAAVAGDLGPLHALVEALRSPYTPAPDFGPGPTGYVTYCGT